MCLGLGITPVFAPPRETGFQASIESYNGRWQAKVWSRFHHATIRELQTRSDRYVAASHQRAASRIESAPTRWELPADWKLDLSEPLEGTVIFIRRTNESGHVGLLGSGSSGRAPRVGLLGHDFPVSDTWCHRLARCHVDLTAGRIRVYRLRRREPTEQPEATAAENHPL